MRTKERLNAYFESTGIRKEWFARKIGMPRSMIYHIVAGNIPIPHKYWEKMIGLSQGFLKPEHLISDCLAHNFKNYPFMNIEEIEGECKWIITAKRPEKNP